MARRFAKVLEEEIEEAFFHPSDLVNTKTTIPVRVGEEKWIDNSTLCVLVYIHLYSPFLRGIVVQYTTVLCLVPSHLWNFHSLVSPRICCINYVEFPPSLTENVF